MIAATRYLTTRPGKAGSQRFFWQPPSHLRGHGFKPTRLSGDESTARQQAEQMNARLDEWRAGGEVVSIKQVTTVAQLISSYKSSFRFREKSAATRKTYGYALSIIKDELGAKPLRSLTSAQLQDFYRALRKTPAKAASIARVMRLLMEHARRADLIAVNPASAPAVNYTAEKATLWQPQQVDEFVKTADKLGHFTIGTAVMLNSWLGQRKGDILSLRVECYQNGVIHKRQNKTGAEVMLPVDEVPALKTRLQQQLAQNPKHATHLLPAEHGRAMSEAGFAAVFAIIRRAAGLPATLVFRALRHSAVSRMAEAGVAIPQIAAVTGHSFKACIDIVDRYNIRTGKMATEAFRQRLSAESGGA